MPQPFIFENLKSNYCKIVFSAALFAGFFITPKHLITGRYLWVSVPFMLLFAFSIACMVRVIKERVSTTLDKGSSIFGFLISVVGLSALQACGLGAPLCGASIGLSILSAVLPSFALQLLVHHGLTIVLFTMALQIIGLYSMKCFKINHFKACNTSATKD